MPTHVLGLHDLHIFLRLVSEERGVTARLHGARVLIQILLRWVRVEFQMDFLILFLFRSADHPPTTGQIQAIPGASKTLSRFMAAVTMEWRAVAKYLPVHPSQLWIGGYNIYLNGIYV